MEKEKCNEPTYGIITEVGDLGLGFEVLVEEDQKKVNESNKNNK